MAYELPIAVLVTDINGGPIANRAVSIGIYPTQFRTGTYSDATNWLTTAVFANEDENRNAILDADEDGAKETCFGNPLCANRYYHNGSEGQFASMDTINPSALNNGRLDPRNIATVPMEVITDANGLAVVKII